MSKVFEDEFMDLQTELISVFMEALEIIGKIADKVYVHGYNSGGLVQYDAFAEINGEVVTRHKVGFPDKLQWKLLDVATNELCKLDEIGKKYDRAVPTELKLCYDVKSGKLDAQYQYREFGDDEFPSDLSKAWYNELCGIPPQPKHRGLFGWRKKG